MKVAILVFVFLLARNDVEVVKNTKAFLQEYLVGRQESCTIKDLTSSKFQV